MRARKEQADSIVFGALSVTEVFPGLLSSLAIGGVRTLEVLDGPADNPAVDSSTQGHPVKLHAQVDDSIHSRYTWRSAGQAAPG